MPSMLALALFAATPSGAFQPENLTSQGMEPTRIFHTHTLTQSRLARQPAFQQFLDTDGAGWRARFDEDTGAPLRAWGRGIAMPSDERALIAELSALLDRHHELFRFEQGTLRLKSANYVERLDTWYVDFAAPREGVDVWRGGLTARIKNGNLVMLGALAYGQTPTNGSWSLNEQDAIRDAIGLGPVPNVSHGDIEARRVWLPQEDVEGLRLTAAWEVRSRTTTPPGKWVVFVDAENGGVITHYNEVRFVDGSVSGWHHERTLDGSPLVLSPMLEAVVSNGTDVTISDFDGLFSIDAGNTYSTDLNGDYVEVFNTAGPEGFLSSSAPDLEWTTADATQAEISTYVFLHHAREWGRSAAPEVGMVQGPIRSYVNIEDMSCNAYFDGNVNFFAEDNQCNNTGEIADVNYHEWGHGFHAYSLQAGTFDGSLSEGASDTVSFLMTRDNVIAPHFFKAGWGIRDVAPNRVYPDDYSASSYAVHSNGLIFGGAMWDLLDILQDKEGEEQGYESTVAIFTGLLKGGPGVAESFEEALFADDDDGDLENGTPHECEIIDAFALHGLGPLGSGGGIYKTEYDPPSFNEVPDLPFEVDLKVESTAPNCFTVNPTVATVHYRVDGARWQEAEATVNGTNVAAAIPAQEFGAFVEYWIEAEDESGGRFALPLGEQIAPYSYFNGPTLEVDCKKFDNGPGGFTHALLSGEPGDGADDWQRGTPAGRAGDPAHAFSGDSIWGNDLGQDNFNGEYQNDKKNELMSPPIDTRHYLDTFLHYRRWLTVEDGTFDQAKITADGEVVWKNYKGGETDHHIDTSWVPHSVDLEGAGDSGLVQVAFSITSDGGLTLGGWNIDDFCILAPDTPDNRLGISGIEGVRDDDRQVTLSWTQPLHEGAEEVFLVRRSTGFPQGPDDGEVIWTGTDVNLGSTVTVTDHKTPKHNLYYAVYASDGTNLLSWTREGYNALKVNGDGEASREPGLFNGGGCGCDSQRTPVGLLALLGVLGVMRRRRV